MSWGQPLSLADVDQLVQTLGPLTEEQLKTLRAQLCPGDVSVGDTLEDVLRYWIDQIPRDVYWSRNYSLLFLKAKVQYRSCSVRASIAMWFVF